MPAVLAQQVIGDIQASLLQLAQKGITPDITLEVETVPEIAMPMERKLTLEQSMEVTYSQALEMANSDISEARSAGNLFVQNRVDRRILKQRVSRHCGRRSKFRWER